MKKTVCPKNVWMRYWGHIKQGTKSNSTLNPLCSCGLDIETTSYYFLHCPLFHAERSTLVNNINEIDNTIFNKSDAVVTRILLHGNESFKDEVNSLILNATIDFGLSTNTFDEPLYLL